MSHKIKSRAPTEPRLSCKMTVPTWCHGVELAGKDCWKIERQGSNSLTSKDLFISFQFPFWTQHEALPLPRKTIMAMVNSKKLIEQRRHVEIYDFVKTKKVFGDRWLN